jgi:hypothetical protein
LLIPISGYNLEIEGCVVNSEKVHDFPYQVWLVYFFRNSRSDVVQYSN